MEFTLDVWAHIFPAPESLDFYVSNLGNRRGRYTGVGRGGPWTMGKQLFRGEITLWVHMCSLKEVDV